MLAFRDKYGYNVYSQNNEDGVLAEIIRRCGIQPGIAIEFGGADGYYCSNIRNLEKSGWTIIQYDKNPSGPVSYKEVTPENVNDIGGCRILSIDIDGNDYKVWETYNGNPDIVIIEINSSLDPMKDYFDSDKGSNFSIMVKLGRSKGYFLLCHTGNLIFLKIELFNKYFDEIRSQLIDMFDKSWLQ